MIVSCATLSSSSFELVLDLSDIGKQYVASANPSRRAKSSRCWLMSSATMRFAPLERASAQARRPMAPTPKTRTVWFSWRFARREAWMRTERGSASAAWSKVTLSGMLEVCKR